MVRETNEIFISIPKKRDTQAVVTVNGDDVTKKVVESKWTKPLLNVGVGSFICKLSNAGGQLSELYTGGQVVVFNADNEDGTREQFRGRIDYPRDILERGGQYLELVGRHRAFFLQERKICHTATGEDPVDILKAIIAKEATELDISDLPGSTGLTTDVEWDYKPFPDCVRDLMEKSGYDSRVDNDLKIQFFEANSILNDDEAIAENDNFISTEEVGDDNYYERTRIIVTGEDDAGIPIIYTAISGVDDDETEREDDGTREVHVKEAAANTMQQCEDLAKSLLNLHTNRPKQGLFKTLGIETLEPGENLWVAVPRQKLYAQYKALQITHLFGQKSGGWRTETLLENELGVDAKILSEIVRGQGRITKSTNPNKLEYSYNISFNDDDNTLSHLHTVVSDGVLKLTNDNFTTGTWVSTAKTANKQVSQVELRTASKNMQYSTIYYSLNNGVTWEEITPNVLTTPNHVGKLIKFKVDFVLSVHNPSPELDSIALLFS